MKAILASENLNSIRNSYSRGLFSTYVLLTSTPPQAIGTFFNVIFKIKRESYHIGWFSTTFSGILLSTKIISSSAYLRTSNHLMR